MVTGKQNGKIGTGEVKINAPQIRKANRMAIFDAIKKNPEMTKNKLSSSLGLSRPTVSGIVDELEKSGLIKSKRSNVNTGGRSAMEYEIISESYIAAGIQLSEHHIRCVLVNLSGEIIEKLSVRAKFSADEEYRKEIGNVYKMLLEKANMQKEKVSAVGVAVQALTDEDGMKIVYMPNETSVLSKYDQLLKYIPGKKRLFHDLTALGYNESLKRDRNVFYLSINNHIGGMILIANQVYDGSNNKAGEVGHMQLEHGGKQCYCGNKGCFDAYCNTNVLRQCINGSLDEFFQAVLQKDEKCKKCLNEYIEYMADAIFSIRMIFDGTIIIGGEIGRYSQYYLDELRDLLDRKAFFPDEYASEYLVADETGEYAIATGAAMYYCEHVLEFLYE